MEKVKIGVIGCGTTSRDYLPDLINLFVNTEVVAVADINETNLNYAMKTYGIAKGFSDYKDMLQEKDIEIIVNLTTPEVHARITMDCLNAGKNVYVEKPLAATLEEAAQVLDCARKNNRIVTCAPETILGDGTQTALKYINEGKIGKTTGASAFLLYGGSETWHPNPEFLYKKGAGPLLDGGPYYIAALAYLFGPVESVTAMTSITFPERTITSQPLYGKKITVEVPTYVSGCLRFKNGQVATIIMTFDVANSRIPFDIEIYGSEGTITIPFPGNFGGEKFFKRTESPEWEKVAPIFCYQKESRGLGVADMASALRTGRKPRLSMEFGYHVLEVMQAFYESADSGEKWMIKSTFDPICPMPYWLKTGEID